MPTTVNKVRNPALTRGADHPTHWTWGADRRATFRREADGSAGHVMTIRAGRPVAAAGWSQTIACRAKAHYRIEATVSCDLTTEGDGGGCVLAVEGPRPARGTARVCATRPIRRASDPITICAYYRTDDDQKSLTVAIGMRHASGLLRVHDVRAYWILEAEECSHPVAIPPPPLAYPAPRVAERVCVVSATAGQRPLTRLLAAALGESAVTTADPAKFRGSGLDADAVLLPDDVPPPGLRSLAALKALAEEAIVIISLRAFAKLAGKSVSLRRVEQEDDPIHARVDFACFATRGFALHDQFAFARPGRKPGSFAQNQFRRSPALKEFCKRHGFVTLLSSVCDMEVTSERPIALFRAAARGALFVLDVDPLEAPPSTFGEPAPAMHLLLSILGREQHALGQYTVPVPSELRLRESIRDLAGRFDEVQVFDDDVPIGDVRRQLLVIGREDHTFGLPLRPRPVLLVRSGLHDGDGESVYGAMTWFKQLVRMEPHRCAYVQALASRFRVAWQPLSAAWAPQTGFARSHRAVDAAFPEELARHPLGLLLDVVSVPGGEVRVVVPSAEGAYERYATWLPRLLSAFRPGRHFTFAGSARDPADRDAYCWREVEPRLRVDADADSFRTAAHRFALEHGAEVARIEVPACDADFVARSISMTDLVATMIEHVVGLQFGLIAVNRHTPPVQLAPFPPVAAGEALLVPRSDAMLQAGRVQAG